MQNSRVRLEKRRHLEAGASASALLLERFLTFEKESTLVLRTPRNYEYSSELSMEMSSLNAADKLVTQCPAAEEI